MWYYDTYLASLTSEASKVTEGQVFVRMPFEMANGNSMEGKFGYAELERRLKRIRSALDEEATAWAAEGMDSLKREMGVAANLQRQFEQTKEFFSKSDAVTLDVELEEKNPFVWEVVSADSIEKLGEERMSES